MLDKREKPRRRPRRMNAGLRGLQDKYLIGAPLSRKDVMRKDIMMDNEPRMQDRRPEGQMFSIEAEIKNMMKEYEMAVRDGDNQRAQMIADQIDRMQQKIIDLQGGIANKMMGQGVEFAAGNVVGISPEDNQMIKRAFSTQSGFDINETAQMLKNILVKKYPNLPESVINKALSDGAEANVMRMAEGGEAEMQMSEQEAMAELESIAPQAKMIEQLIMAVIQMIQQGVSEAEVREFLKEQGLDDEDIEDLFMMVMQQIEQAPAEEPIGQELQGMM